MTKTFTVPDRVSSLSDENLFAAIQRKEEKSFDHLFMRYYPSLCAYARHFVGLEDGEEIVQDMMVWLWERSDQLVIKTSLKSFLFISVRNRCLTLISYDEMRERVRQKIHESLLDLYEDPDFYIVEELSKKIEEALVRLPESYRESFEMNRFQKMTYQEIANQLNVSPKTIDYRIQQALKILRKELKDYLPLLSFLLY